MYYRISSAAPTATDNDSCCFETKTQLEEQSASSVLDTLHALARAKRVQMGGLDSAMREARMEAAYHAPQNQEVALSHVRIALEYKERHRVEQLKYQNLITMIGRLETAHRDLALHASFFAASKTLRDVVAQMGDTEEMMNQIRELVHVVDQEHGAELSRTIFPAPSREVLEAELDAMFAAPQGAAKTVVVGAPAVLPAALPAAPGGAAGQKTAILSK